MRCITEKNLDLDGKKLSPNVVYDKANAKEPARYHFALREGKGLQQGDESSLMR